MNKSTQLIIGMLLGFEKDHEIYDGIDWDSDMARQLLEAKHIAKEDIFSMTPNGKSFFQYRQTWKNLKKLFNFMSRSDQKIDIQDLKKIVTKDKTALDLAVECNALDELFEPEIWVGHSEEMENLWYSIDRNKRVGKDFLKLKSAVAKLEGREIREDQLRRTGILPDEMHTAIKQGRLEEMKRRLAICGDHLRLEDAKLCDVDGDHALYTRMAWDNFEVLHAEWEKHGEIPDIDFFTFKRGNRRSIIESAFDHYAEKKIFNEKVFAGRPDEMIKLYKRLDQMQRNRVDVAGALEKIIENLCADMIRFDDSLSVGTLTDALYKPTDDMGRWRPVIGLGIKKTWDNIDEVNALLKKKGEKLTMAHLRLVSGGAGESCLIKAVEYGKFNKVMEILAQNGERLEVSDLISKTRQGNNVLEILARKGQMELLLKPDLWIGRVEALGTLWENMPGHVQGELRQEFHRLYTKANLLSLRCLEKGAPPAPVPGMAP